MATSPDKMRMTETEEDNNVILPQPEDNVITLSSAENNHSKTSEKLDDIAALENKQLTLFVDKQKRVEKQLQEKSTKNEECDNGKNYRTLLKASIVKID